MKYEERLAAIRHLPWRYFYIDYARLKHFISQVEVGERASNEAFIQEFGRELRKAEGFYTEQERLLIEAVDRCADGARDQLKADLQRLLDYASVNVEGLRKAAKKYDKMMKQMRRRDGGGQEMGPTKSTGSQAAPLTLEEDFLVNIPKTDIGDAEARLGNLRARLEAGEDGGPMMVREKSLINRMLGNRPRSGSDVVNQLRRHIGQGRSSDSIPSGKADPLLKKRSVASQHAGLGSGLQRFLAATSEQFKGIRRLIAGGAVMGGLCGYATFAGLGAPQLTGSSFITIFVTYIALGLLVSSWPADAVLLGATVVLRSCGVITDTDAWGGFSNEVVISVATLGIVAAGVQRTGAAAKVLDKFLGQPTSFIQAQLRLFLPTIVLNSVVNNTASMGILLPITEAFTKKVGMHRGLFLMPLSFIILISGCISIVGTSSNLLMQALVIQHGLRPFGTFEITPVAAPATMASFLYIMLAVRRVFPQFARGEGAGDIESPNKLDPGRLVRRTKRFVASVQIRAAEPMSFEESKLGELMLSRDVYLVERMGSPLVPVVAKGPAKGLQLSRGGSDNSLDQSLPQLGTSPSPRVGEDIPEAEQLPGSHSWDGKLQDFDVVHLHTTAEVLARIWELPAEEGVAVLSLEQSFHVARGGRELVEVVIDAFCPLLGKNLACLETATVYADVRVLASRPLALEHFDWRRIDRRACAREYLQQYRGVKGGRGYNLKGGDGLLLDCPKGWSNIQRGSAEFISVRLLSSGRQDEDEGESKHSEEEEFSMLQVVFSGLVFLTMICCVATDTVPLIQASLFAAFALCLSGCMPPKQVYNSVSLRSLVSIVGAFGLGKALGVTNVASVLAGCLVAMLGQYGAYAIHSAIFVATVGLGVVFHGTAVVILMFPVARRTAEQTGLPLHQVLCTIMIGAGCQMLSPVSYQTNMMVYAYGDYSFEDFPKLGFGAVVIIGVVSIPLTIWYID